MKLFDHTVFIAASPSVVFRVIADPRSKLTWVPAIRRVQLETKGAARLGTKYLASSGAGPFEFVFHEQIVEWIEDQQVAYEGRSSLGYFKTVVTLQLQDEGTRVHNCMDYVFPGGLLGAVFGQIVALVLRRPMQVRASARLKEVVEKGMWKPESA